MDKQVINKYLAQIKQVNVETAKKELLKDLLYRLFGKDHDASEVITKMSLGAEHSVLNIPHKTHVKTGRADTQYGTVIIEFENNLQRTGEHAKEQLKEYLLGNWESGNEYNYTLIATDCITWKIYAPSYEDIMGGKELKLIETDKFTLVEKNEEAFYYFLDRYLFRYNQQPATLENIKVDFGETSAVFINSSRYIKEQFDKSIQQEEVKLQYDEWRKFLSLAYGSFKDSAEVFIVHTYLSVFSKLLAYTVLTHDEYIDDSELKGIIKGEIFEKHNINNFIDNDFYYWVTRDDAFAALKPVFRKIAQQINNYNFNDVKEDVLKGVYQELIDLETRHALGEYYTPDWLCEKIVNELPIVKESRILDPACGSGSFLRAVIDRIKRDYPKLTADSIANAIVGIDIHPLSVQIAKTTVLLALSKKIKEARKPVTINVFLSNTLLLQQTDIRISGNEYKMNIDGRIYHINTEIFENAELFDKAVYVCDKLAEYKTDRKVERKETLKNSIAREMNRTDINDNIVDSFYDIYRGFKQAKDENRDTIWKFILQNLYKPFFFKGSFDFVIGNPPWLTYSSIKNKEYQDMLLKHAEKYSLVPKTADMPHLELAAIFLAHSASHFLKADGKIAFVLPRSFLTASHHNNTREGRTRGFVLKSIWDLKGVTPLFRIPSCVLFADRTSTPPGKPKNAIPGYNVSGRLKQSDMAWDLASKTINFDKADWHLVRLGVNSAFSTDKTTHTSGNKINEYKNKFMQGATIVPRNFYFVELTQDIPKDWKDRVVAIMSSSEAREEAKHPWKELEPLTGRMATKFIFRTALSKNIVPFGMINPPLIVLPININKNTNKIKLCDYKELKSEGYLDESEWFNRVETLWVKHRTEKNKKISSLKYLNWQNKLTLQDLEKKYLVIYTASAKDASAVVVNRSEQDLTVIIESISYWYATDNYKEACYLACFINSNYANKTIKAFQALGLFGPRHIHKKILDVPLPIYDKENENHLALAELGKICEQKTESILQKTKDDYNVGALRMVVRDVLKRELEEIDALLKKVI